MKQAMAVFLFCMVFVMGNQLRAARLHDACGDDHAHFDVKTEKDAPAPAALKRERRESCLSAASMRRDASDATSSRHASESMAHG